MGNKSSSSRSDIPAPNRSGFDVPSSHVQSERAPAPQPRAQLQPLQWTPVPLAEWSPASLLPRKDPMSTQIANDIQQVTEWQLGTDLGSVPNGPPPRLERKYASGIAPPSVNRKCPTCSAVSSMGPHHYFVGESGPVQEDHEAYVLRINQERAQYGQSPLPDMFPCSICMGKYADTALTTCGHRFCQSCTFQFPGQ